MNTRLKGGNDVYNRNKTLTKKGRPRIEPNRPPFPREPAQGAPNDRTHEECSDVHIDDRANEGKDDEEGGPCEEFEIGKRKVHDIDRGRGFDTVRIIIHPFRFTNIVLLRHVITLRARGSHPNHHGTYNRPKAIQRPCS